MIDPTVLRTARKGRRPCESSRRGWSARTGWQCNSSPFGRLSPTIPATNRTPVSRNVQGDIMLEIKHASRTAIRSIALLTTALLCGCQEATDMMNAVGDQSRLYPLHTAVQDGDLQKVKLLVDQGEDVNEKSGRAGLTPLHFAALFGRKEIAEFLIAEGAIVDSRDVHDQMTPLHLAAYQRHTEVVELLVKHGANVHARDSRLRATPLHFAAGDPYSETGDSELRSRRIFPPKAEIVELFLSEGADIDATCGPQNSMTALDIAEKWGHQAIVDLLQNARQTSTDAEEQD